MRSLLPPMIVALVLLAGCGGEPAMPDTSPGVSWKLAEHRARTLSDVRYDVRLTIPAARTDSITGETTIRFRLSDAARPLVLDFHPPARNVLGVYVDGKGTDYAVENDHLVVPAKALVAGENTVAVRFVAGEGSLNRNDDFLYTLFVPDRARFALPVFDQPNLKARFRLTLRVPEGWKAVANGPLVEADTTGDGATFRFAETKPLPTYLFAFAAGRFETETAVRDGRTMTMYHRETDAEKLARNRDALFDLHATALAWLEDYTGIPYPFDKFDFVLIPSFQYGGMEHPGAILYRQASLMLDASATQNQLLGRASVIAHETAHMWFGDLVTMNWFDDVWTKEVFANFMAAKIVNPSFPEVNHDLRFLLAHYPAAYAVDRTAGANPIRQPLDNLQQAGTLYGAIIYQKAPIVMKHLERLVGEEAFRDGLREYLGAFAYGNATWPDLIGLLDRRADADLTAWSRVWVEEPGRPTVEVRAARAGGRLERLTLFQSDPWDRGRLWPQRLVVLLGEADTLGRLHGVTRFYRTLDRESMTVTEAAGRPAPSFILPNGGGVGYGLFVLDPESRAFLLDHVADLRDTVFPGFDDAMLRGAVWVTLWDALLEGRVPPGVFLDRAMAALPAETNELLAQHLTGDVTRAYWRLLTPKARRALAPDLEALLWSLMEKAPTTTRKAAFFNAFRDVALSPEGVGRLRDVWARRTTIPGLTFSERDETRMALELAVRGLPDAEEILDTQAARITNPDRRARFAFVRPALSPDRAVRDAFFESLKDEANRAHEPWVLEGVRYLHHPLRAADAEAYLRPSLELLEEIQRTGDIFFPKRWLDATLGGHQSLTAAAAVRSFLDALPPDYPHRLRAKILQSADGLFRAARIVYGYEAPRAAP
ncbi:M1 family aminopeptidase [Rhodocaloribacter sp.]